ncbi:MAG: hypothetical protein ACP5F3_04935 [Candidatus Syntrophosphaera sp.]
MYFKLLEAEEYDLDVFYSSELQRLYVQVDFEIPKNELDPTFHYGVFLERDAQFQAFTVDGKTGKHYLVNNLLPEHFVPGLTKPELLNWNSPVLFRGFYLPDLENLPETVHFRMWYYLRVPPFKLDGQQMLTTGLDAGQFWYPRNTNTMSRVNVRMTTIPYISVMVGSNIASQFDKQYSRIHTLSYVESVDQPSSLVLIRD